LQQHNISFFKAIRVENRLFSQVFCEIGLFCLKLGENPANNTCNDLSSSALITHLMQLPASYDSIRTSQTTSSQTFSAVSFRENSLSPLTHHELS